MGVLCYKPPNLMNSRQSQVLSLQSSVTLTLLPSYSLTLLPSYSLTLLLSYSLTLLLSYSLTSERESKTKRMQLRSIAFMEQTIQVVVEEEIGTVYT